MIDSMLKSNSHIPNDTTLIFIGIVETGINKSYIPNGNTEVPNGCILFKSCLLLKKVTSFSCCAVGIFHTFTKIVGIEAATSLPGYAIDFYSNPAKLLAGLFIENDPVQSVIISITHVICKENNQLTIFAKVKYCMLFL